MQESLNLIFDSGTLVLIWLVQLVIYPGFQHYPTQNLIQWHEKYSRRLTYVVLPLMVGQLTLAIVPIFSMPTWLTVFRLLIVLSLWILTFAVFVPLHSRIQKGIEINASINTLIQRNWYRTILWSLLFLTLFYPD